LYLVHPNVDKKSFIRWKQRDIHEKRAQRKQDIQNLKLSNQVNQTLQLQIDEIVARLENAGPSVSESNIAKAFLPDEAKLDGAAPTGSQGPSYAQMLMSLFEECKKAVEREVEGDRKEVYIKELKMHKKKIGDEIIKNESEVAKLEKEEKGKITSEGLHEGFSSSVPFPHEESGLIIACCETYYEATCYWIQGP
jgi:cell division cycle protein 37